MSGNSELLLLSDPAPQSVIKSLIFDEVGPTSTINNNPDATYDFHIKGSNTQYLDLNESSIVVKLRVYNVVANLPLNLKAADDVAGCNFFLNALFKDVSLILNSRLVEGGNALYPYKSTIDQIFNFRESSRDFHHGGAGYGPRADRVALISRSMEVVLTGTLCLDFLNQPKLLLPGIDVHIRLTQNLIYSL